MIASRDPDAGSDRPVNSRLKSNAAVRLFRNDLREDRTFQDSEHAAGASRRSLLASLGWVTVSSAQAGCSHSVTLKADAARFMIAGLERLVRAGHCPRIRGGTSLSRPRPRLVPVSFALATPSRRRPGRAPGCCRGLTPGIASTSAHLLRDANFSPFPIRRWACSSPMRSRRYALTRPPR